MADDHTGTDRHEARSAVRADEGAEFARGFIAAAGLAGRVEVSHDPRAGAIRISGPDQFGLMGTTSYVSLAVALPAPPRAIAVAVARHVFGEFYATDGEIAARAAELPLALALALAPDAP